MSQYTFKLPDLGEGTVESEIVEWHVKPGDVVTEDTPVVDMMTDKATIEITAPVNGKVVSLAGEPGEMIAVGSDLVVFETEAVVLAETETLPDEPAATTPPPAQPAATPTKPANKPLASPATRKRARDANIDLHDVPGSGTNGRITKQDLQAYLATPTVTRSQKRTDIDTIKVIGLRRKIAEQMQRSKRHIPHFSYIEEIDVTELEKLRNYLNANRSDNQPKLSYLPFFMLALAKVLDDFPQCNATFDDEQGVITRYGAKHVGVATQTDNGLVVPVVKHAESLDLWQCAREIEHVANAARSGKAPPDILSGSTITLSSLGALGGIAATPVINYPEVAIIGVNKVQERPVIQNGMVTARLMMNLSSSFDHRIVDGYDAAQMIQAIKGLLEHPAAIFIAS